MEVEDRETTDSGSLSGIPESGSPSSGGDSFVRSVGPSGGVPGLLNMNISMEMGEAAANTPAMAVSGGGVIVGRMDSGGMLGGSSVGVRSGGNGDSSTGKKKRGRPRKYDADGNLNPAYLKSPSAVPAGFTLSTPPSYEFSSGSKRGGGRPSGSGNWQILASLGESFVNTAGGDFTPHVVTAEAGEDIAGKILTFAQKDHRGICVLSANGPVSNVTLLQPGSCGGLLTYEGRFEILTLTGSYTVSDNGGIKSCSGGLSVSLASSDGRVIGGSVAGMLTAASPIQIVVGSFVPNGNGYKMQHKRKPATDLRVPPTLTGAPVTVTAATPISQAPPEISNIHPLGVSPFQNHGEADRSLSNRELPSDTTDWNGSGPTSVFRRQSPDINIPMPAEDQ